MLYYKREQIVYTHSYTKVNQMTNNDVISSWANSRTANSHTGNLRTDGSSLWSYNLLIGYTDERGRKVAKDYMASSGNFYSRTTSNHVSKAKSVCQVIETP